MYRPEATNARHDAAGQACGCSACGGRLRQIGQDVSEQLEYVPSRFKVIRHVRPKLACMACESIFQAAAPSRPIARGVAGPGLLAHVLVSKYCDHQPLYRQSRIYAREGVLIERSTMAGWVGQSEKLLDPLVAALGRYVLAGSKLHADDTPVAVLSPGRGKTKTGRLWVYVRDDRTSTSNDAPAAWLRYSPDRKGEHPQAHLKNFKGVLQADAYAGFASSMQTATSSRLRAGRMPAGRSGICTRAGAVRRARLPSKRSGASVRCMRSKPTSAAARRMSDAGSARREPGRCSKNCSLGCEGCSGRWGHSHLLEFIAGDGERYGTPDPMYDEPGSITGESTRLTTALNRSTLSYVYDFGDYWDHRIKVEKKIAPMPEFVLPFCAGGACATPPEDCGGVPGYAEFVRAMANPDDPEHDNLVEWIGADTWDPLAFDSIEINDRLAAIKV